MKRLTVRFGLLAAVLLVLAGCGGGSVSAPTTVTGVASKGIIKNGVVRIFQVGRDGTKGKLLKETSTDASGAYSADLGSYSGPIVVEVSGSYLDEVTGESVSVSDTAPLRAAAGNVRGNLLLAVTPLTELALERVEDPVTKKVAVDQLDASNALVGKAFNVEILATRPVDVTAPAASGASTAQLEYSLVLAAISGMMHSSGKDLGSLLSDLKSSVTVEGKLAPSTAIGFQAALKDFVSSSRNLSGIRDVTGTGLVNVGGSVVQLKLQLVASSGVASGKGVSAKVILPDGVTVKAHGGSIDAAVVSTLQSALFAGGYQAASGNVPGSITIGLVSTTVIPLGNIVTVYCDVAPGITVAQGDFQLIQQKVVTESETVATEAVSLSLVD